MFAELTKKLVADAIRTETAQAIKNYGETYNSYHEGYAVLKEEVEEASTENEQLTECLDIFWKNVVKEPEYMRNNKLTQTHIEHIKEHAEQLALEAVQVAVVCNKMLNGI